MLSAMAEIGALRTLMIHAFALRLLDEPDPATALKVIEAHLTSSPTLPANANTNLDPAISDLLAALTDQRIETLLEACLSG